MFITDQSRNDKKLKQLLIRKIKISFSKLEQFYNNLIDEPLKPQIQSFFIFDKKNDLKENFQKYNQQQQLKNGLNHIIQSSAHQGSFDKSNSQAQEIASTENKRNKSIIFQLPNSRSQKKVIQDNQNSKISYFHISQHLKNVVTNNNFKRKTFEGQKKDYEQIQRLNMFLYHQEAVFFLLNGKAQLHKKIDHTTISNPILNNLNNYSKSPNFDMAQSISMSGSNKIQQSISSYGGSLNQSPLKIHQSNLQSKSRLKSGQKSSKQINELITYKRLQQLKQTTFFSLYNYKNFNNSAQEINQQLKFVPKSECILAKIMINSQFGLQFLKRQFKKLEILSALLLTSNKNQIKKSSDFKKIFDAFEQQNFKRDMMVCFQNRENNRIHILGDQGEVQALKMVFYKQNTNSEGFKNIKVCNIKGRSIFNAEIYLKNSKNLKTILKSHSFNKGIHQLQQKELNQNEQQRQEYQPQNDQRKKISKHKQKHAINHKGKKYQMSENHKKPPHLNLNDQEKHKHHIYLGKKQDSLYKFYNFNDNLSNFSIKTNSAYATVYSIELDKFENLVSQRMKNKFIRIYQQFYVTYLRRSIQKLDQFQYFNQKRAEIKNKQLINYAAISQAQRAQHSQNKDSNFGQFQQKNKIQISLSKLQFHNKKQFNGLKRKDLAFKDGENLQKQLEMIKLNDKEKYGGSNVIQSFKEKIENLIVKNLRDINSTGPHDSASVQEKNRLAIALNQYYTQNLAHIFMHDKHRSEGIQRHNQILNKKTGIFQQKYKKKLIKQEKQVQIQNDIFLYKEQFDPTTNRDFKLSLLRKGHPGVIEKKKYLKGFIMEDFTDTIKNNLTVRINETNKIREQFIKIESKCQKCNCYDDLESYKKLSHYHSSEARPLTQQHRHSSHDVKYHTMKIGVNWKTRHGSSGDNQKYSGKTALDEKNIQKKLSQMAQDDQPFEKVYNRIKVLKQKSLEKFNFTEHLVRKSRSLRTINVRKRSAPLFLS